MFKVVHFTSFLTRGVSCNAVKRFFLSKAYKCEEAWANRLKNPVFAKIDTSSMYHDLDLVFQNKQRVSVLDVDLLFNATNDPSSNDEVEDVLLRMRLCPECSILPEGATHAVIRYFMEHIPKEELLNVLSDRVNYGLFPDYYLVNMLMDKYLKEKDACSAVKIAVLQMLQEDFAHPIMKVLALHCCYNYLESPDVWMLNPTPEENSSEDPIKVRVQYIRKPYFDDHFDIQVPNHFVGKTLWLFGHSLGGPVGASSQLVGLVLYEKYEKCVEFLKSAIATGTKLHADAVAKAKEYALKKPKQGVEEGEESKEEETAKKADENAEKGETVGEESGDVHKKKLLELLGGLNESALEKGSLLKVTEEMVKEAVKTHEMKDVEELTKIYKQWEVERDDHIKYEIERAKKMKAAEEISRMKKELEKEEQKLFYFDRQDEIEIVAEEKAKQRESVRYYKPKGKEKAMTGDEYIPPTV